MFVIWKRPDGFHGAKPEDFKVVELSNNSRLWLHKTEKKWYPFQVSGGWQDEDQTTRLNGLANLIGTPSANWTEYLVNDFHASLRDNPIDYYEDLESWLFHISRNLKGDKWEQDFMEQAMQEIQRGIEQAKPGFTNAVSN